jgi:hypothetical protein
MNERKSQLHQRAHARYDIHAHVDVYDRLRDIYLGRLVNIHSEGLMLVGDVAVEEDRIYTLDLHLPVPIAGCGSLQLGVDCLWVRTADQEDKFWAGFAIIDLAPEAAEIIRQLVELLGETPPAS